MENLSNVQQVIGVATKKDGSEIRGQGKKGPWVMYSVILENGIKLNVFGPVKEGDTVYDLVQSPEYHTWQGKVKQAGSTLYPNKAPATSTQDMGQPTNAQIMEAVRKVFAKLNDLEKLIKGEDSYIPDGFTALEPTVTKPTAGAGSNREYVVTAEDMDNITEGGEPIDLSEIPF